MRYRNAKAALVSMIGTILSTTTPAQPMSRVSSSERLTIHEVSERLAPISSGPMVSAPQ